VAESFASSSTQAGQTDRPPTARSPREAPSGLPVAFRTLGCKVNQVESEAIGVELLGAGCRVVDEREAAVVVVNTCTVTAEADHKARKAIRHAARLPQRPVVVVTGCLAALEREAVEALGERVVVEADKEAVAARVAAALGPETRPAPSTRTGPPFHARAMLKVEDGCDAFCAYCIVPHARGGPRSVPLPDVVAEAERLVEAGVNEIVLTGINLGRYDWEGAGLPDVVGSVARSGVRRLRLSSIEPQDITAELLDALAHTPATCPHLHVPLQSGSDAVLARMRRTYGVAEYESRIAALRHTLPEIAISTDVMAGFPGESAADAAATYEACERMGFARLHVFRYSARPGTPAADMPNQVPAEERARRAARLRELDRRLRTRHAKRRMGQRASLLVERVETRPDGRYATGTTEDYLRAGCACDEARVGEVIEVRLDLAENGTVYATRL